MNYNIVVEGPNNTGKSSFINELLFKLGDEWSVEHMTGDCPNDEEFYDKLMSKSKMTIFDRCHIGETVYPKLHGREANLTHADAVNLSMRHCDNVITVFVDAEISFIYNAYSMKDEKFDLEYVMCEREKFNEFHRILMNKYCNNVFKFVNRLNGKYVIDTDRLMVVDAICRLVNNDV